MGGRATSDTFGTDGSEVRVPRGVPNSVRGGNLGKRLGEMGALKREASSHRPNTTPGSKFALMMQARRLRYKGSQGGLRRTNPHLCSSV